MTTDCRVASSGSFDTYRPCTDPEFVSFGHFDGEPSDEGASELRCIAARYCAAFGSVAGRSYFLVASVLAESCPGLAGEIRCNALNAGLLEVKSLGLVAGLAPATGGARPSAWQRASMRSDAY